MALNIATLKTRSLTAAVFVIIMLAGLLWDHWIFFILFSVIHFGCWYEYQRLIGLIDPEYARISSFHKYGVMIGGWCIMLYFTNEEFALFGMRFYEIGRLIGLTLIFIFLLSLLFASRFPLKSISYSAAGLLYISVSLGLMMDLRCEGLGEL